MSLWIYAYSRGIGSAREVERRCEHDPGFRWLTLQTVMHDGTKITAQAGPSSFKQEELVRKHLAAAREHVAAMGDPRTEEQTLRQAAARERARRERVERLEQALVNLQQIGQAKRPGYARARPRQTGVSATDPEARIMRHGDGHYALSSNVQISTVT